MTHSPFNHLAIIPDGNRRWAKQHGIFNEEKIYEKGAETISSIVETAFNSDISCVTLWASSYANLMQRPKPLVNAIERVFIKLFKDLAAHPLIHQNKVKVDVLGEWREILKPKTVEAIDESIGATSGYSDRHLTVLIGYDGLRERGAAMLNIIESSRSNDLSRIVGTDIKAAAELLRRHSWTGHLPEVDLILRTGSWQDPHNSAGFLSMISGDSQYAFPQVLWPDLNSQMLKDIFADFVQRERRMGR